MEMQYITLLVRPSVEQGAALKKLLDEQQDRSSANYHRWLTSEQYADRFGLTTEDMNKIIGWLEDHGLRIGYVANARNWVSFSGTADEVERAFYTQIHHYSVDGKIHFANATPPSIPTAFSNIVSGILGLTDFLPKPLGIAAPPGSQWTGYALTPPDVATIYYINPLYNLNPPIDGTGQTIVVVGQSDIDLADIEEFRSDFGLSNNDPQLVLFGADPGTNDAQLEADLDLEWAGAIAQNATIYYVYATNAWYAVLYAVDHPSTMNNPSVLSMSFGTCEPQWVEGYLGNSPTFIETLAQEANSKGITWVAASADSGAAGCDPQGEPSHPLATGGLAVQVPASIPEVTAVGGTEFLGDDATYGGNPAQYWGSDGSALGYIPERAWNDSFLSPSIGLAASGGGISTLFAMPSWQINAGILPNVSSRAVPDIALTASWYHDPYAIICSTTNCGSGNYTFVGGTSAAAPVFAGIVALLNQYSAPVLTLPGLGNINQQLYQLSLTNAFNDITAGSNIVPCDTSNPTTCGPTGQYGFNTAVGYDPVTGLGSVNAANLIFQWPTTTVSTLAATAINVGTVTLNGSANPNGLATTVWFEWGTDSTLSAPYPTSAQSLGSGTSTQVFNVNLTGLNPSTTYYFRAVAANGEGTSKSWILSFTTLAAVGPAVSTNPATSVTSGEATLNGGLNPNGALSNGWFEYGTSSTLSTYTLTPSQSIGSDNLNHTFSWSANGLAPGTTYYYMAVGSNGAGTGNGNILTFTTALGPSGVTTGAPTSVTSSGGVLNGTINPAGSPGSAYFWWGTDPTMSTHSSSFAGYVTANYTTQPFSYTISNWQTNATYYVQMVFYNSGNSTFQQGNILTYRTPPSIETTLAPNSITTNGAVLNGTINPAGSSGTANFYWGTNSTLSTYNSHSAGYVTANFTAQPFSMTISGLQTSTPYYFQIVYYNSSNGSYQQGNILSFTPAQIVANVSPTSLTFASQVVGTLSTAQTVTMTNPGTTNLTVSSVGIIGTNAGDFAKSADTCTGATITPNGTCTVSVTFTPLAMGSRNATLSFTDNAFNSPQTVTLSGTGTAPVVSFSPSSLAFPPQIVGTSSVQTVTLSNTGTATLTISGIIISGPFSQTNTCGSTVNAGASCTIAVTFKPAVAGTATAGLIISDNAGGSPQMVLLTGTGVVFTVGPRPPTVPIRPPSYPVPGQPAPVVPPSPPITEPIPTPTPAPVPTPVSAPAASLAPASLTFAAQVVGVRSSAQTVTLVNTGNAPLTLVSITTSANFGQTNNCGSSVAAKGSCTINVTFLPTAAGSLSGALTITDNSGGVSGSKQTVTLSGIGEVSVLQ
jgi:hypothetical protein